jgi:hypothetical protein
VIIRQTTEGLVVPWRSGGSRTIPLLNDDEVLAFFPEYEEYEEKLEAELARRETPTWILPLVVVHTAMLRLYPELTFDEVWSNLDRRILRAAWLELWWYVALQLLDPGPAQ